MGSQYQFPGVAPNYQGGPTAPVLVDTQTTVERTRGAAADMTISSFGVRRNETKIVTSIYSTGHTRETRTSYETDEYPVVRKFQSQPLETKRGYFKERLVQIIVQMPSIPLPGQVMPNNDLNYHYQQPGLNHESTVLDHIDSMGSQFAQVVANVMVVIKVPYLSNLGNTTPSLLTSSPGYRLVQGIVNRIQTFNSLENLTVVLALPHTTYRGIHELQLVYGYPFYQLPSNDWRLHYSVPWMGISHHPVDSQDIAALNRFHYSMVQGAGH